MSTPSPARHIARLHAPAILNALADGAYITDLNRTIVFWNAAAERIVGWSAGDVLGKTCFDNILLHTDKDGHELCGKEHCPLHRSIVTGTPSDEPILVYAKHRDGSRVPVEVSVAPLRDADGVVYGGIELFRDLSADDQDLRRAQAIQALALESPLQPDPRLSLAIRYTPCGLVGGDFYRVERLDADRYAVMVADVMGHGMAAALYTMQLRSLWEDWRAELTSPARFLGILSRQLNRLAGEAGYFATAVALVLDAATGDVRLARAGHPAPLLVRRSGAPEYLGSAQPAVGMLEDATYREESARLGPGDSLLCYTDGAIEASNADGAELGPDGLVRLLAEPGAVLDGIPQPGRLEELILAFSGAIHPTDDLTLLALSRRC